MKRRLLLRATAASVALLATTCASPATAPARRLRLGAFTAEALPADGSRPQLELDVMEGLRAEGFVRGTNMTIEWRHAQGNRDLYPVFAKELLSLPVDILVGATTSVALAAKAATRTIPIVMLGVADAEDYGVIESYAHPGGNITGTAFDNTAEAVKRLELLHEVFPTVTRVTAVGIASDTSLQRMTKLRQAADLFGIEISGPVLQTDDDLTRALEGAGGGGLVTATTVFRDPARVVSFAAERRIPAVFSRQADVEAGGLMSYGSNRRELRTAVGRYVRRIADGASPGDLPVQLPQTFDIAVNLATARGLGVTFPASVMARVTKVIE